MAGPAWSSSHRRDRLDPVFFAARIKQMFATGGDRSVVGSSATHGDGRGGAHAPDREEEPQRGAGFTPFPNNSRHAYPLPTKGEGVLAID